MTAFKMQPVERSEVNLEEGVEIEFRQIAVMQNGTAAVLPIQGDV